MTDSLFSGAEETDEEEEEDKGEDEEEERNTGDVISHISTLLFRTSESRSGLFQSSDPLLIRFMISFLNSFPVHLTLSQPIPLFGNPCYRLLGYLCILFAY
jgi:TATA-binding protein-associated factor Taf7